jgi:bifunctional DNA-binding transcriptional regulator/antitoxin component of YhaV-PrlF toxin-antitoxin module
MESKEYRAKITSKNQLTLPAGVSAFLHVGPGQEVRFEVSDQGVTVKPLSVLERLKPLIGSGRVGDGMTLGEINAYMRELRGHDEFDDRDRD